MKFIRSLAAPPLAALLLTACQKHEAASPATPPPPQIVGSAVVFPENAPQRQSLNVEVAQSQKMAVTHMTGHLYWDDDVTARVFTPVAGRVTVLRADIGQTLAAGAPLTDIDSPDFGQARADARTADAAYRAAEKAYNRAKDLLAHGAAAEKDVENAEAADLSAIAARDSSRAKLALYGGDENGTNEIYVLRSPIGGLLVERNISAGQEVRADQMLANAPNLFAPLFVVTDPSKMWLQLDVPESDLAQVRPGQSLRIHSKVFPDVTFNGVIDNIGAEMDPLTRTARVRGLVDNPNQLLKAEMYVEVDALADGQKAVDIPATAVFKRGDQYYLFVEQTPGHYEREQVRPGSEQDGKVPIMEGIHAGERVVTDGCLLLEALLESNGQS